MKYKSEIKSQKGSITLYVLISMMFFLVIVLGIYFNSSNKVQKQEEEIEKIQKEYEKNNINDIYEETYNEYVNTETPTIQVYDGDALKSEVIGEKVSSRKTIYLANKHVTLKFLSRNISDKYAYSTTENGEKIKIEENTLDIDITTTGKTIYVYIEDNNGNYSKHYTAVTMILVTLQDKTIYVEEGKETNIGEIQGENAGNITFGQVKDSTIINLEGDTITGLKAGTTTLIATEEKAGATATITVKVVKIELASTSGTILIGDSRTVKIIGTNIGTLSIRTSDEEISTASINNSELVITAKKEGNATITLTESNVKAIATYEIKVANVALTPNGGTYTMPTEGNATIKTTLTTVNAEKIETAWSDNAGEWSVIENNKLVEKTDCTNGTYYLYVRINGEAIYKSKEFIVESSKITIKPSTTNWTNQDITSTVTYGSTLIANKKAGYGTSLANAKNAASTSTATSLTATANGYFYAEATDTAGNKVTTSLQITNIDKTPPEITALFSEDQSQALIVIKATDNNKYISLQTSGNHTYTSSEASKEMIYNMYVSTDGKTTITATDAAGNKTTKTHNIKFLFTYNNQRTENTGGWSQNYHKSLFGDVTNVSYASGESLFIQAQPTTLDAGRLGSWYTNNSISLSGYDMIRSVSFFDQNSTGTIWLGLSGEVRDSADINTAKSQNDYNGSSGYWVRLQSDISSISDSKQCMIGTNGEKSAYVSMFLANMYIYSFK